MTISMYKIIFENHLKESGSAQSSNIRVQRMFVLLVVRHWLTLDKALYKDGISCFFLVCFWKENMFVAVKVLVECNQIVFLNVEIYLLVKSSFEGLLSDWKLEFFRKK